MSTLAEISIFPIGAGESVSGEVSRAVKIIEESGLAFEGSAMGTTIEGSWPEILKVVDNCMNVMKENNSRVYMTLKVDHREGDEGRITKKKESLRRKLRESI